MVSAVVPPPVRKPVEETVAVQLASRRARLSVTVTAPRAVGPMVVPGAPVPRAALAGTLMVSAPLVTVNVAVVGEAASMSATVAGVSIWLDDAAAGRAAA